MNWSDEFPTEEGWYWFYGEYGLGCMGAHFREDWVPKMKLHPVQIIKLSNSLLGLCEGQPISNIKFDRNKRSSGDGWIGKWIPAVLPVPPES